MVDRQPCGKFSKRFPSRGSSSPASEFDEDRLLHLEGKYLDNGLEIRPPSGTNHQQPGSHLSIDTRLSELSLDTVDDYNRISNGLFYQSTLVNTSSKNKHRVQVNKPNCYITSPFKQGYQVPRKGPCKVVDPSYELKNLTKESIARVQQQFRKSKPPSQPSHYTQRLRKARLRTTGRPFSGSGPTIKDCKGIQSGVQVMHNSGPSVLYSNEVYSRMASPSLRPQSPTELLRPDSSIHCPSRASIEDSVSEDSCEVDSAVDSCINAYSKFERVKSTVGGDDAQVTVGNQDIIHPKKDIDVQKIELEIPQHDAVPGVDEENPSSLSEEECFPKRLEESQRQNEKESSALKNNQKCDKKHRTQSYDGCKPFHDNDDNDDDDDDDNQRKPQSIYHSNRLGSEGGQNANWNIQRVKEDESKPSEKQPTSCTVAESCSSVVYESRERTERNIGHDVIIDSPIMTGHVRKKDVTENADDNNVSAKNSQLGNTHNDVSDDDDDLVDDEDEDEDLDTDRIPSAQIWKNLDQLNLSMNTYHTRRESDNDHLDFDVKARKVQSAGAQRKSRNLNTSEPNSYKIKQRSRPSTAKQEDKKDSTTMIDEAGLLRHYLTEESRRFSVDLRSKLPGYFMEQFDIIQQEKFGNASLESDDIQEILGKAIVKCQEGETECIGSTKGKMKSQLNRRESDSVLWACKNDHQVIESYSDPMSLGVFFTMDSTTCTEMESMSERTEDRTEDQSDSREFSETIAGSARVPHHKQDSRDTLRDDEKSPLQGYDYRRENIIYTREKLEVLAKAKHLTDPSSSNKNHLAAPHQPLEFYINAKPPTGCLYYFAYGGDMNIKRMSIYLRREHKRRWGVLFGFKLRFNKKGSSSDAGGFANVEFSAGSSVEGCVYTLTDAELSMLDNCMGYPKHYSRAVLPVWMCNSYQPSLHGVAQYCVPAVLYIAEQQWIQPDCADCLDSSYSVSQCLKAADLLTPSYVEYLSHLTTTSSPVSEADFVRVDCDV